MGLQDVAAESSRHNPVCASRVYLLERLPLTSRQLKNLSLIETSIEMHRWG
jgi:hypothetical protein